MRGGTRRQALALATLAVALIAVVVVRRGSSPSADPAAPYAATRSAGTPAAPEIPVTDIQLERLQAGRSQLGPAERNPFRFEQTAPPPASPRPPGPARPATPAAVVPQGPPPPPPIPLKFIGVLDQAVGVKVAILSDSRGNVFYGKEGAIIDGRFQLLRIGVESADLVYADGRGRQTIRMSGQ